MQKLRFAFPLKISKASLKLRLDIIDSYYGKDRYKYRLTEHSSKQHNLNVQKCVASPLTSSLLSWLNFTSYSYTKMSVSAKLHIFLCLIVLRFVHAFNLILFTGPKTGNSSKQNTRLITELSWLFDLQQQNVEHKEKKRKESILDLSKYLEKNIRVKFAGGREAAGILKGYDPLLNLVLDNTTEYLRGNCDICKIF